MPIAAKVIYDSLSPMGVRLTTLEVVMPRIILAEFNTHRVFSRNSASSRAIPVEKMIERVQNDPFIPLYWGKNQKGMQADEELSEQQIMTAKYDWLYARDCAVWSARYLSETGVHKQIVNRLLEPFLWHTVIVTATEWSNFFAQRCHPDAMPEMRLTAEAMRDAMEASEPTELQYGEWHSPYIYIAAENLDAQFSWETTKKVSVARCARVSYLQHNGTRSVEKDLELFEKLQNGMHWSPFEHVATPMRSDMLDKHHQFCGNFRGWYQFRKDFPNECR